MNSYYRGLIDDMRTDGPEFNDDVGGFTLISHITLLRHTRVTTLFIPRIRRKNQSESMVARTN